MSGVDVIEAIKVLPKNEYEQVVDFIFGYDEQANVEEAIRRSKEIDDGTVNPLTRESVFAFARQAIR